jgi:hypothetical protein
MAPTLTHKQGCPVLTLSRRYSPPDIDNWMKLNGCDAWSRKVFLQGHLSIHDVVKNQVLCDIERVSMSWL